MLYCIASRISQDVPRAMMSSLIEMSNAVIGSDGGVVSMASWTETQLMYLARTCAALCAISRQHAGVDAATRSVLLKALEGTDAMVPILASGACKGVAACILSSSGSSILALKNLCIALSKMIDLLISLVQTFGRKTFGKPACTFLGLVVDLLEPAVGKLPGIEGALVSAGSGEGIIFFKQLVQLISVMANCSSASVSMLANELQVSHRLLLVMVGELNNSAVCGELLGEVS